MNHISYMVYDMVYENEAKRAHTKRAHTKRAHTKSVKTERELSQKSIEREHSFLFQIMFIFGPISYVPYLYKIFNVGPK